MYLKKIQGPKWNDAYRRTPCTCRRTALFMYTLEWFKLTKSASHGALHLTLSLFNPLQTVKHISRIDDILVNHIGSSFIPKLSTHNRVSDVRCCISSGINSKWSQPYSSNEWNWFLNFSMHWRLGKESSSLENGPSINSFKKA